MNSIRPALVGSILLLFFFFSIGCFQGHHAATSEERAFTEVVQTKIAQERFHTRYGRYGTFEELSANRPSVPATAVEAKRYAGYYFQLRNSKDTYELTAVPEGDETLSKRTFYCDQSGIVRHSWGTRATDQSPAVK